MVPGRLQFAGETVYGFVRNTLGPRQHRQRALHEVRALPVLAVHVHPGEQLLRRDPVRAVLHLLADRVRRPAGAPHLAHLHRRRHVEARRAGLLQARHDALGRLRADPDPAGAARVLLQHPGPTGHADPASVRQHVRRPPAADPVRHRWRRTAHQRQPPLRGSGHPVLRPRHRGQLPGDAGACSSRPTSSRCSTPCTSAKHSPTSTDPTHKFRQTATRWSRRRRKEKPWKAPST